MATITFPYAASGVLFAANGFDAQAGCTPWSPSDSLVGSGVQQETAGNHGNSLLIACDDTTPPFDISTLGSAAGTITSAIVTFANAGTYSTVGPGTTYSFSSFGDIHTEANGASWSSSGTWDASSLFEEPPVGPAPGASLIENLPTFPWSNFGAGGSIDNGVIFGYQITVLSIEFTYTPSAAPIVTDVTPTHGDSAGGTVVTLTGTDLDLGTVAYFNGTAATDYSASSSTQATCIAPAHAVGQVTVTVV